MHRLRHVAVLLMGAFALAACSDVADRGLTGPTDALHSFTDPDLKGPLEIAIRGGISCLIADDTQEARKLRDFDAIVVKADKGEVQAVTDWVNNFIKWAADYGTSKKTGPPGDAEDCDDRTPTYGQALHELANLLYLYSGQYDKISSVDEGEGVDAGLVVCLPDAPCEGDGQSAFVRAGIGTFDFPVILGWRPLVGPLPGAFGEQGEPVPPFYEFYTIPEGVIANGDGWGRYICVSHDDFHIDGNQLFRFDGDDLHPIEDDDAIILCPPIPTQVSNPFLRRAYELASRITAPVRPKLLYAAGHRAIGGPATAASPHGVVRAFAEPSPSCDNVTDWADAKSQTWDIASDPYPSFTSFASLTVYLRRDGTPTLQNVSAQARRFTSNDPGHQTQPTGEKDLGLATSISSEVSGAGYKVTFTWPAQPVKPGGRVEVNISSASAVDYGWTNTTDSCVLKEIGGSQRKVAGSVSGHPQGGDDDQIN